MLGRLGELGVPARQAMMLHALARLPQLAQEDRVVLDHLRVAPFVDTRSSALQPPSALYDPRWRALLFWASLLLYTVQLPSADAAAS